MVRAKDQRALRDLLGEFRGDPAFAHLAERAQDSGHLAEADFTHLLAAKEEAPEVKNLRRHVLFCSVCAEEFLRRAAPASEEKYRARDERRRVAHWLLAALLILGVGAGARRLLSSREVSELSKLEAPAWTLERSGTGRSFFKEGEGRLYAEVRGVSQGRIWIYAFLREGTRFYPLSPDPRAGVLNPLTAGVVPEKGWPDPGRGAPAEVVAFLSSVPVVPLEDPLLRKELAKRMEELMGEGHLVADILGELKDELCTAPAWVARTVVQR